MSIKYLSPETHDLIEIVDTYTSSLLELSSITSLHGCSKDEILEAAKAQAVEHLPITYSRFLEKVGKQYGRFMIGDMVFYPDVFYLKEDLLETLSEHSIEYVLEEESYVFWGYGATEYMWFNVNNDDPMVTYWRTSMPKPIEVVSFLDVLYSWLVYYHK